MFIAEEEEFLGGSAHGYTHESSAGVTGYRIRMDWMLALGRTSLDTGDLRTALKYFMMVQEIEENNRTAIFYSNLTRRLMRQRRQRSGRPDCSVDATR
jgi:hypothetical protein